MTPQPLLIMSPQTTAFTVTAKFPESPDSLQVEITIDQTTQQPSSIRAVVGAENRAGKWTDAGAVIEISLAVDRDVGLALRSAKPENGDDKGGNGRAEQAEFDRSMQKDVDEGMREVLGKVSDGG